MVNDAIQVVELAPELVNSLREIFTCRSWSVYHGEWWTCRGDFGYHGDM